eukprot:5276960-Lingulodinium_polyedra.AAC.1
MAIGAVATVHNLRRRGCRTELDQSSPPQDGASPKGGGDNENLTGITPKIYIVGTARVKNKYHTRPSCPAIARSIDIGKHEECL